MNIQDSLISLRDKGKIGKFSKHDLENGTICLSNVGTIGGVSACPLLLAPQVCIVAIGRALEKPHYSKGKLEKTSSIQVTFGCDHRVLDGATVARFSSAWKKLL